MKDLEKIIDFLWDQHEDLCDDYKQGWAMCIRTLEAIEDDAIDIDDYMSGDDDNDDDFM